MSQFENIAFISYKREDEKWAKWMQRRLEHYKLPSEAKRIKPDTEFINNPRHVFKDTTDLSGGVLAQSIKRGLDSSKFLIVICSPRAAQSPWVCKEVQEFIDSGREEFIIPFIVEGEPNSADPQSECFPVALRSLSGERELLGININENNRDFAFVKVIARLFDIRFDILWNRFQREAKRRTRIIIAAVTVLFLILLGIIAAGGWSYQKIKSQQVEIIKQRDNATKANDELSVANDKLSEANASLSAANDSIARQKETLQKAFDDLEQSQANLALSNANLKAEKDNVLQRNYMLAKNNAVLTAKEANNMIDDGDILGAINILQTVIPDPDNPNEHPYVIELEQVMRKALQTYNSPEYKSIGVIDNIGYVYDAAYNIDGTLIATAGEDGYVRIWDAFSGKFLYSLPRQDESVYSLFFEDKNTLHLSTRNHTKKHNLTTHKFVETADIDTKQETDNFCVTIYKDTSFLVDKDRLFIANEMDTVKYIDLKRGDTLSYTLDYLGSDYHTNLRISYDKKHNRIGLSEGLNYALVCYPDNYVVDTINNLYNSINSVALSPVYNDVVTVSNNGTVHIWHKGESKKNYENLCDYGSEIIGFDISGDILATETEKGFTYFKNLKSNRIDSSLFYRTPDWGVEGMIQWTFCDKKSLMLCVPTQQRCPLSMYLYDYENMSLLDTKSSSCDSLNTGFYDFIYPLSFRFDQKGKYAYSILLNTLSIWDIQDRKFGNCIFKRTDRYLGEQAVFSDDSRYMAFYTSKEFLKTLHIIYLPTMSEYEIEVKEFMPIISIQFIDNDNILFATRNAVEIANLTTRKITNHYACDNLDLSDAIYCSANDQIIACSGEKWSSYKNIYVWDKKSERLLYSIPNIGIVEKIAVYGSDLYVFGEPHLLGKHTFVKYKLLNFNEVKEKIMNFIPYRRKEQ